MDRLFFCFLVTLFLSSCQWSQNAKKDKYYENYYHPQGAKTPQEEVQ